MRSCTVIYRLSPLCASKRRAGGAWLRREADSPLKREFGMSHRTNMMAVAAKFAHQGATVARLPPTGSLRIGIV